MANPGAEQTNVVANKARHLIFFEESELCYNYKTQQWTEIPAYDGIKPFSINDRNAVIGLARFSSGSVDLQVQSTLTGVAQQATITTAAPSLNEGGRAVLTGCRLISNGGTITVRAGSQDFENDPVSYSVSTAINPRSRIANFRQEGRYLRLEFIVSGGFEAIVGAQVEFSPQGRI